jgi:hypothetical protein
VPAAYDSTFWEDGSNRFSRVVGRSLEFLANDSARYAAADDVVERLPDGDWHVWASDCESRTVPFRREGDRGILTIDPNIFLPQSAPPQAVVHDTLEVVGSRLVQLKREEPTTSHPSGRNWRLEYQEGQPSTPVCG